MALNYEESSKMIKALSDSNRIQIIEMLSCEEMCACQLLEHFQFTQPTLSHHMKVLMDCDLVNCRKDGLWSYYSLNNTKCQDLVSFITSLMTSMK